MLHQYLQKTFIIVLVLVAFYYTKNNNLKDFLCILETCYRGTGRHYQGNVNTTALGTPCQKWSQQVIYLTSYYTQNRSKIQGSPMSPTLLNSSSLVWGKMSRSNVLSLYRKRANKIHSYPDLWKIFAVLHKHLHIPLLLHNEIF